MTAGLETALAAGRAAMERGAWREAAARFDEALALEERAEILEERAWVAWWEADEETLFATRERAYRLYSAAGDRPSCVRVAAMIAADHLDFRGQDAIATGWLERARQLSGGIPDGDEHGWILLVEGDLALHARADSRQGLRVATEAVALGRERRVPDFEAIGLAQQGTALLGLGRVEDGMRCFDEAAAVVAGGDFRVQLSPGWTLCYIVSGCVHAADFTRAAQWAEYMRAESERLGGRHFIGICRASSGAVLATRGEWDAADEELSAAVDDLTASRPAFAPRGLVRLGELRARQGRSDEARALFEQALPDGSAILGLGAIALDEGDAQDASDAAERVLRGMAPGEILERIPALELLVRARVALGQRDSAADALKQLESYAAGLAMPYIAGRALLVRGELYAAQGDGEAARRAIEDAVDRFAASGAPYDGALARLALAGVLRSLGRTRSAETERAAAQRTLAALGAGGPPRPASEAAAGELTPREREILVLVAHGLSDAQIAERLVLSPHTVHRHVANIRTKLGLASRAAAVAYAARQGLI